MGQKPLVEEAQEPLPDDTLCDNCRDTLDTHTRLRCMARLPDGTEIENPLVCATAFFKKYR